MNKRVPVVAANWKMNKTCAETVSYLSRLLDLLESVDGGVDVIVFPPFTALRSATLFLEGEKKRKKIPAIGSQNMNWEVSGAFTGEVSAVMLEELGVKHVILGHSERRRIFSESNEMILKKAKTAVQRNMIPVVCVGETLDERNEGKTEQVLKEQLYDLLNLFRESEYYDFIIAYEPVWAIGTGVAASPEQANDACRFIRALIGSVISPEIASKVRILYGGSVEPSNFRDFILEPDIDGGLVGTASLSVDKFFELIKIADSYR